MYFSKTANLGVSQDHYSIQAAFNAGATTPTSINAIQTSGPYFKFVPIIYPASGGMTVWNSPFAIPIPSAADPGHIVADASISDVKKYRRLSPQQQAFVYMTAPPPLPAFTASFSPNTISITR
jgi:hypothetical protein